MAGSVAGCVKSIINRSPFISEMLIQDVISFSNLARYLQPKVEELYGEEVSTASIVMAVRRYSEELKRMRPQAKAKLDYEIQMKTNIYDVNFRPGEDFHNKLAGLYEAIHPHAGDFLNMTVGSHESSICVSEKHRALVDKVMEGQEVLHRYTDLVALTIIFHGDFLQTPGIMYLACRKLAWENINIIEIVSTMNVLTFVISREDSHRAYKALEAFLDEEL